MLLMTLLFLLPFFRLFYMSFTDWDGIMPKYGFTGLDNYIEVFQNQDVWVSLKNNLLYIINGALQNIVALIFAVILTSKIRGKNIYRAAIFLPFIINSAAVAFMFNFLFDYEKGPITVLLKALGREPVSLLGDAGIVNYSIVFVSIWRYTGYTMMLYIAAFQSISPEIYESSMLDGANSWQNFWYITLPSIRQVLELNLFLTLSGGLTAFTEAFIMTNGGPGYASSTFVLFTVKAFTQFNRYGFAAALSVVLLVIVLIVTAIQRKIVLRDEKI